MSVSLEKGGRVSLDKIAPGVTLYRIGLGWTPRGATAGAGFDLDALVLLLNGTGEGSKVIDPEAGMVFYNRLGDKAIDPGDPRKPWPAAPDAAIVHHGDNLTGEGELDDEIIDVHSERVNELIKRILIAVSIHQAHERGQKFSMVDDAYVRIWDGDAEDREVSADQKAAAADKTNPGYQAAIDHIREVRKKYEITRYDLSEAGGDNGVMQFASIYRTDSGWSQKAIGEGYSADKGLRGLALDFGVDVA